MLCPVRSVSWRLVLELHKLRFVRTSHLSTPRRSHNTHERCRTQVPYIVSQVLCTGFCRSIKRCLYVHAHRARHVGHTPGPRCSPVLHHTCRFPFKTASHRIFSVCGRVDWVYRFLLFGFRHPCRGPNKSVTSASACRLAAFLAMA